MTGERVISIPGLCRQVLKKWRLILVFGIITGILLSAYQFLKHSGSGSSVSDTEKKADAGLLRHNDTKDVLDAIQKSIDVKTDYIKNSILLQIDNTREGYAAAYVYVTTDALEEERNGTGTITGNYVSADLSEENSNNSSSENSFRRLILKTRAELNASRILDQYRIYVDQEIKLDDIAEEFGTAAPYLREVISTDLQDDESVCFRISVQYVDQDNAEAVLDRILEQVKAHQDTVLEKMGAHTLSFENRSSMLRINRGNNGMLNTRVREINDLYDAAAKYQTAVKAEKSTQSETGSPGKKTLLKYALAGFAGGCVLICLLYAIAVLLSRRVLSARELIEQFKVNKIAYIPANKENSENVIDRIIGKIGSSYLSSSNEKEGYAIAVENIAVLAGEGARKVALISDMDTTFVAAVAERLRSESNNNLIYQEIKRDSVRDIQKLKECDAAVLIADENNSKYSQLDTVMEQVQLQKINVLGAIICA